MKSYLLFLLILSISNNQTIESYNYKFDNTINTNSKIFEYQKGELYSNRMFTHIILSKPINQIFRAIKNQALFYYIDEGKATRILGNQKSSMPFHEALNSFLLDDFGLSLKGFTLNRTEIQTDQSLLITYWSPPKTLNGKKEIITKKV